MATQNEAAQAVLDLQALYEWLMVSNPDFTIFAKRVKADLAVIDAYVGGPQ